MLPYVSFFFYDRSDWVIINIIWNWCEHIWMWIIRQQLNYRRPRHVVGLSRVTMYS